MPNGLQSRAIVKRVREVLTQGSGTLRTIAAGTFEGDAPKGLPTDELHRRANINARVDVSIEEQGYNSDSPPRNGPLVFIDVLVAVRTHYKLEWQGLDDDARDDVVAQASEDADAIRQALEFNGNLTATEDGDATGLTSGLLLSEGPARLVREDHGDSVRLLTWEHRFTGTAQVTQATS